MNKIRKYMVFLGIAVGIISCNQSEKISTSAKDKVESVNIISMELDLERNNETQDIRVLETRMDTLPERVSPLPIDNNHPELFKIEITDSSNKILFGSQYRTNFTGSDTSEKVTIKFTCTVPMSASKAKIYYQESENLWKLVQMIEL